MQLLFSHSLLRQLNYDPLTAVRTMARPLTDASQSPPHPAPIHELPPNVARKKIIPFAEICRCGDEVWIELDGQIYRLRRTKQGKLILTK